MRRIQAVAVVGAVIAPVLAGIGAIAASVTDCKIEGHAWLATSPDTGPDGWLFPSEKLTTPLDADNVLERYIRPKLKPVGLEWVDFRAMRRTHSSLMKERGVDPKLVADQQGHTDGPSL